MNNLSNNDQSELAKKIKTTTNQLRVLGLLTSGLVAGALYAENYFTNHPTVEDLYFGGNSRVDSLWTIGLPLLAVLLTYLFVLIFRLKKLQKESAPPKPAPHIEVTVKNSINNKTEQLERLAKLRSEGAISDAEFESLKKEIMQ